MTKLESALTLDPRSPGKIALTEVGHPEGTAACGTSVRDFGDRFVFIVEL